MAIRCLTYWNNRHRTTYSKLWSIEMKENPVFSLEILRDDWIPRLNANFKLEDAFQRICHDLLQHRLNNDPALAPVQLVPFPTPGADGAVDSYGYGDADKRLIIECKKNETLDLAEDSLTDLGSKLKKSLEKPGAQNSRFGLWFHPGFKKYIYCVSCYIDVPAKYDGFRQNVKEMIASLVEIPGLAHLKGVEVTLYAWNDLSAFLEENKFVRHQWLKPAHQVPGCEPLSTAINPDRPEFKDYLSSEKSPYVSRDEFLAMNPGLKDFRGENEIYDLLMKSGRYEGCIIHGEGGTGKTRLMLELGLRAEKDNWLVYKITPALQKIEDLEPLLYPGSRHLLLFDYIEENRAYTADLLEKLALLAPRAAIKVIANCRNTYRKSPDFPEADDFLEMDLTLKGRDAESQYKEFVISKIIGHLAGLFEAHKDFYGLRPAFAVFIRYIYEKYKDREPDLGIKGIKRFREWLKSRLSLTFKKESSSLLGDEKLYYLLALLPAKGLAAGRIIKDFLPYVRPLLDDGWLEQGADPDRLRVIHDSITDEILELWLIQQESVLLQGMETLFKKALEYDSFKSCFRAVERLADRECLKNRDQVLYTVFTRLLDQKKQNLFQGFEDKFVASVLLEDETVVRLLAENLGYFQEYVGRPGFGLPLSFMMNRLSKGSPVPDLKSKLKLLFDTWMKTNPGFLASPAVSVRIISTFLLFFGKEEDFGPHGEKVERYVTDCLEKYPYYIKSRHVISDWVEAGGEKEVVAPFLTKWLEKFPEEMETRFPICAWLDAWGEKELVTPFLTKWLEKFPEEKEASFVIGAWLEVGGEKEVVAPFLTKWLEKFPEEMETSFVFRSWLEAGGEKEVVEPFLTKWLEKFPEEKEGSFVIWAWLNAGGEKEVVAPFLTKWLEKFPEEMETRFPICAWLNAGGEKELVAPFVQQWLEQFQERLEASYIIKAWIKATRNPQFIESYALRWLQIHKGDKEASFVVGTFCRFPDLPKQALEDAVYWCRKFAYDPEVLYKLAHLSRYHAANPIFADRWLIDILSVWISPKKLLREQIANIETILCKISQNPGFCRAPLCRDLLKKWFLSVNSFQSFTLQPDYSYIQRPTYFEVYAGLLLEKEIDPLKHEEDIKKFLAWVARWAPSIKSELTRRLDELKAHLPEYQHLWAIVQ